MADTWPKMTPYQRNLLRKFADSKYGDLHGGSKDTLSLWRLKHEGMIESGIMGWWSITQRGRDYVRELREKESRTRRTPHTPESGENTK
jgi:hypothetical protein